MGIGRETLVAFRPRLLVVLAMLVAEEVVDMVAATGKELEGWSAVAFSTLLCWKGGKKNKSRGVRLKLEQKRWQQRKL